ncbi:hypothetical protein Acsp04_52180 [Actinomadura sp. NBRC 104425]|uniref:hypothetical protein n=1 Tax=Actinomadura sp. NBRC 104425 TaxID=3032204 RepID=UPI00249FB8BF|nr:hypothetical protein [Actinomadura sp. NBRC 104425]GLZ14983.1 hypothetical protein Acsp04_52180 [Actinomadura sp. NBRC 104425]
MADTVATVGLVQRVAASTDFTCAWIGPTPTDAELLIVTHDGTAPDIALAASLTQMLSGAATNYREVRALHASDDAKILTLQIDPV